MKFIRPLCFLLVLCMLCIPLLCACDEKGDESSKTESNASADPYYDKSKDRYVAKTSGNRYEGETITILTCGVNPTHESEIVKNTYEDGETATLPTVVNDALKERADRLEDQLGVKLEESYIYDLKRTNADFATAIRSGNLSMTEDYQIVVPCLYDAATLAAENQFYNLATDLPNLQYAAPWWNQAFNESVTFGNQLYFMIGDIGLINKNSVAALYFNYEMWMTLGLDVTYGGTPYDLVRSKKWTMDTAFEVVNNIGRDLDESQKIDYNDEFGWGGQLDDMWSLFFGSGERIAQAGEDGYPRITVYNERSAKVIEKMQGLVQNKEHYVSANDYFGIVQWPSVLVQQGFTDGRCMFYNAGVGTVIEVGSQMQQRFGMLPMPLYDDTQEEYQSLINPWTSTCFAVPACVPEEQLAMVADVLNVLGAESANTVAKEYSETAIKYMKIRDDESIEMLEDYILPNSDCDIGMVYAWGGLDRMLHDMAANPVGTFASTYEALSTKAQTALDETIAFFKAAEK